MFKFLKNFEQFRFAFIITAGFKMSKKIKLTTIFEIDDNQHVDEIMLERQISSIGKIHSFDIDYKCLNYYCLINQQRYLMQS